MFAVLMFSLFGASKDNVGALTAKSAFFTSKASTRGINSGSFLMNKLMLLIEWAVPVSCLGLIRPGDSVNSSVSSSTVSLSSLVRSPSINACLSSGGISKI